MGSRLTGGTAQPEGASRLLVDPRRVRSYCLAELTRATDRYLRSAVFLQSMRLGFGAITKARALQLRTARVLLGLDPKRPEEPIRREPDRP